MEMDKKVNIEETRKEAEKILAQMNELIRGKDFVKMVMDERYEELRCKIVRLGWLPLCKSQKVNGSAGNWDLRVEMKLVAPDSEEARASEAVELSRNVNLTNGLK